MPSEVVHHPFVIFTAMATAPEAWQEHIRKYLGQVEASPIIGKESRRQFAITRLRAHTFPLFATTMRKNHHQQSCEGLHERVLHGRACRKSGGMLSRRGRYRCRGGHRTCGAPKCQPEKASCITEPCQDSARRLQKFPQSPMTESTALQRPRCLSRVF